MGRDLVSGGVEAPSREETFDQVPLRPGSIAPPGARVGDDPLELGRGLSAMPELQPPFGDA